MQPQRPCSEVTAHVKRHMHISSMEPKLIYLGKVFEKVNGWTTCLCWLMYNSNISASSITEFCFLQWWQEMVVVKWLTKTVAGLQC